MKTINSSRWLSSSIFLGLGVFAGTKLGSGPVPEHDAAVRLQGTEVSCEVRREPQRGPSSIPSGPAISLADSVELRKESPLMDFNKAENYLKLKEFTKKMRIEFENTYLRKYFTVPREENEIAGARRVLLRKLGAIQRVSEFWTAKFILNVRGLNVPAFAKIDIGAPDYSEDGTLAHSCGGGEMAMTFEGQNVRLPIYVDCGPSASRKGRLFVWTDTEFSDEFRDVIKYIMLPLPEEGGSGYFLDATSLKWHATEEIRWEKGSEVDFRD